MVAVCRAGEAYFKEILAKYGREPVLDATRALPRAVRAPHARRARRDPRRRLPGGRPLRQRRHHAGHAGARGDGDHRRRRRDDGGLHRHRRAGGGPVQLRRRDHDQRVPAPHQVPDDAARSRRRGLLPAADAWSSRSARSWRSRSPRRPRATTCRSTCSSSSGCARSRRPCPTGSPPAPTATRCRRSRSARIPETGKLFIQGDLNAGGTGGRPDVRRRVRDDHPRRAPPRGTTRSRSWSRACRRCASSRTGCARTPAAPGRSAAASASSASTSCSTPAFITFSLERKATPPWGLWGGKDGAVNGVEITSPDGSVRHVRKATQHPIAAGETREDHDGRRRRLGAAVRARSRGGAARRARGLRVRRRRAARLRRRGVAPAAPDCRDLVRCGMVAPIEQKMASSVLDVSR